MGISQSMVVLLFHILIIICYKSMAVSLMDEIREAELKIVGLESMIEESISILDSKNMYIKEREKLVTELTTEFDHLQSVLLTIKQQRDGMYQVRLLWATARRNNFELHSLESKAQDAETRLEVTQSRVETVTAIVNQQWIQIQHLEQALVIAQKESNEVKRQQQVLLSKVSQKTIWTLSNLTLAMVNNAHQASPVLSLDNCLTIFNDKLPYYGSQKATLCCNKEVALLLQPPSVAKSSFPDFSLLVIDCIQTSTYYLPAGICANHLSSFKSGDDSVEQRLLLAKGYMEVGNHNRFHCII
ncbi:hypothetical protein HanIR_Chr11g0530601 [Helianthus annuus]|nr:hypothetical protein HanIR_Chr11g0530601 [Helianthus annuus]